MNFKTMLSQLHQYAITEAAENERIERLRVKAEGVGAIRYDKDKLQTQPAQDRAELAAINLIAAKEHIARKRRKRLKVKAQASGIFHEHLNNEHAIVMDLIYVQGKSIQEVADITGLSVSWIYDIKHKCVDNLNKKVVAEFKTPVYAKVEEKE